MFAALPILGLAGTLAIADRSRLRVRMPGTSDTHASLDLETTPEARLMLASRRMQYSLSYQPTGMLRDVGQSSFRTMLMNSGTARVQWSAARAELSLEESASYGNVDFSSATLTPGPAGQPPRLDVVPAPQVVRFASSRTTLASHLSLDRWTLDPSVGYQLSGGADARSRSAMPWQRGGFGQARAEYTVTRRNFAATTFTASETSFSSGPEAVLTQLDERWRHLLSRVTTSELKVGGSVARIRETSRARYRFEAHPVAEATLDHRFAAGHRRMVLRLSLSLAPIVNQLQGTVDERLQGTVAATHTVKHLTSHALVSASESMPPSRSNATRLFFGEIGTSWAPQGVVGLEAGLRGYYQRQEVTGADFFQATLYAGVTFSAEPIHF